MERVPREEVIHSWLERDLKEHAQNPGFSPEEIAESEKAAELLIQNPEAASIFLKHSFVWYKTRLGESEFRQLHSVWQNFDVPDHPIIKLGKELSREDSSVAEAIAESSINGDKIREIAEAYPSKEPDHPLIITSIVTGTTRIADGNHRATGLALHMARGGEYQSQEAYIGFTSPPTIRGYIHRLRAKIYQLRH